ncbi:C-type lectin [Elysia marginata]|uniref:C-type lectin n=1 Tax=Elysia marginata TaxID=1093978 RepID=A0AAV4HAR5_9GAST|nr:C-type lectin [Elysia marginata]
MFRENLDIVSQVNYYHASDLCRENQGHLVSTRTTEKMQLIQSFMNADIPNIWIGANDIQQEGTFVWEDDGSPMTAQQQLELFRPGEPSDGGPGNTEDCVSLYYRIPNLNDATCHSTYAFVCEMQIVVTSSQAVSLELPVLLSSSIQD